MDAAKAYEILKAYRDDHHAELTPDENDAFSIGIEELMGQASVNEEYERLASLGHYDKK